MNKDEANLVDLDNLDVSDEEIRTSHKGLQSTSTNMLVDLLANTDKIVPTDERWHYSDDKDSEEEREKQKQKEEEKKKADNKDDEHYAMDDDLNDYKKKDNSGGVFTKKDDRDHKDHKTDDKTYSDTSDKDKKKDEEREKNEDEMDEEELMLKKLDMIRKLGELKQNGATLSKNYNLNSSLKSMQYEYKLHSDVRSKQNAVTWMSYMLVGIVKGAEILNDNYNPFEIKLGGLKDRISGDMNSYYDVLGEIYEKYNQPGKKMAPELRLLLMVSGAALSLQVSKVVPNMVPELANKVKNDEDGISELREKAAATSDKHREALSSKMKQEHDAVAQRVSDLDMIRNKEIEYKKMKQEAKSKSKLRDALALSTDSPGVFARKSESENSELRREKAEIQKLEVENMAKMQRIQELTMIKRAKEREESLRDEKKKLDNILQGLSEFDEESKNTDNDVADTEQSTESTISINPNIDNILSKGKKKNKSSNKAKGKTKGKSNSSTFQVDEITLGSKKKNNKGKTKMTLGSKH